MRSKARLKRKALLCRRIHDLSRESGAEWMSSMDEGALLIGRVSGWRLTSVGQFVFCGQKYLGTALGTSAWRNVYGWLISP